MNKARSLTLAALVLASTAYAVGCAEPAPEPKGSASSKLLAPRAVFIAKASPAVRESYGIAQWKMFRGKRDVVITGYDAKGKALKGVSVGFYGDGDAASLRARVHDGSFFAARHSFGGKTATNRALPSATSSFLRAALADVAVVRASLSQQGARHTLAPSLECGGDLSSVLTAALQCVMGSGQTPSAAVVAQCVAAAQSASSAGTACQGGASGGAAGDPIDSVPNGTGTGLPGNPFDPSSGGATNPGGPWDPSGDMGGAGGYGDMGGAGGAGDMGGYGGGFPGDIQDPWGDSQACPSCMDNGGGGLGGYGDIQVDPSCGDVGFEGQGGWGGAGEMGGAGGYGDMGGEMGGAGGYGDVGGGYGEGF